MEITGLILIPFLAAILVLFMNNESRFFGKFSFMALLMTSALFAWELFKFTRNDGLIGEVIVPFLPDWGLNLTLGMDNVASLFLLLLSILAPLGILYSTDVRRQLKEYHALYLLLVTGAYGLFLSHNLFFIFFFLEFEVLTAYFLISLWKKTDSDRNAFQFILFASLGGLLFLAFAGLIFIQTGAQSFELSFLQAEISKNPASFQGAFLLLLSSLLILSTIFPFHAWGPLGYQAASRGVNTLLVGVVKKIGPYLLISLLLEFFPEFLRQYSPWLIALALANIIYVGWVTLAQKDPKLMAGYSSSSHMGYILLSILSFTDLGLTGALLLAFAHGLTAALLFANLGRIEEETGPFKFGQVAGLGHQTPFLATAFSIAALAGAGLPGLASFVGEIMVFFSLLTMNPIVLALAIFGVLLSAVYLLRAIKNIFHGPLVEKTKIYDETPAPKCASIVIMAALILVGVAPLPFIQALNLNQPKILEALGTSRP